MVRAVNADVPFNQFVTEHIAGDLLDGRAAIRRMAPTNRSPQPASGGSANPSIRRSIRGIDYADRTDNQIDVFGKSVLGLTLACARCHDHKFDPIAARDYYCCSACSPVRVSSGPTSTIRNGR